MLVQHPNATDVDVSLTLMTDTGPAAPPALQNIRVAANSRTTFNIGFYVTTFNASTRVTATAGVICERAMYGPGRQWAHDSVGYTP